MTQSLMSYVGLFVTVLLALFVYRYASPTVDIVWDRLMGPPIEDDDLRCPGACGAPDVSEVLMRSQGGLVKRIDENRELLELLQKSAPEFLADHSWVAGWLKSQDGFLNDLRPFAPEQGPRVSNIPFPRPWPGNNKQKEGNA